MANNPKTEAESRGKLVKTSGSKEKPCKEALQTHSWGTQQEVLVCFHGSLEQATLDAVEAFEPFKRWLGVLRQSINWHQGLEMQGKGLKTICKHLH